jgi:isopenicillin N synthase-like dioxygenase
MLFHTHIPVIDLSGYLKGSAGALEATAAQIRQSCLGTGFFYIVGHGVDDTLLDSTFVVHRRFHALPTEEKLHLRLNQWHRGYEPFASSQLKSSARFDPARYPNQLESFLVRHDVRPDTPGYGEKEFMGPNQWPEDAHFCEVVNAYDAAMRGLGLALLPAMSVAMGEEPQFLSPLFDAPSTALRLVHYPAQTERPDDLLGIQPHTDYGFLTILAQDAVDGLEIRRVDGTWIPAPRLPHGFIVNIGDATARWTNGIFNSTPHRVRLDGSGHDRFSIAYFFDPNIEAEIRILDSFRGVGVEKYPPIRYGTYFANRLDTNFPKRTGT